MKSNTEIMHFMPAKNTVVVPDFFLNQESPDRFALGPTNSVP